MSSRLQVAETEKLCLIEPRMAIYFVDDVVNCNQMYHYRNRALFLSLLGIGFSRHRTEVFAR